MVGFLCSPTLQFTCYSTPFHCSFVFSSRCGSMGIDFGEFVLPLVEMGRNSEAGPIRLMIDSEMLLLIIQTPRSTWEGWPEIAVYAHPLPAPPAPDPDPAPSSPQQ